MSFQLAELLFFCCFLVCWPQLLASISHAACALPLILLDQRFSKLPSCINPSCLPNLSRLMLQVATMDEQDLKLLARLPALCFLCLKTESTETASTINIHGGYFFQKLRTFMTEARVQFEQPNEEDPNVSLHLWNGKDAMPFASSKSNESRKVVPSGAMPNLELLRFGIPLRALKDNNGDCGNIGLEYLPSLQELIAWIDCEDMTVAESDAALAALRNACKVHPNHPTPYTHKFNEDKMVSTHDKEDENRGTAQMVLASMHPRLHHASTTSSLDYASYVHSSYFLFE